MTPAGCGAVAALLLAATAASADVSVRAVAKSGDPAPGTNAQFFYSFDIPSTNGDGHVAFVGELEDPLGGFPAFFDGRGVWVESPPAGLELIAREGFPAPGVGTPTEPTAFREFGHPLIARDGGVLFTASLMNPSPDVTTFSDEGVWLRLPGQPLQLIAREGSPAPDAGGGVFDRFNRPVHLASGGNVVFMGELQEGIGGVTDDNNFGVWLGDLSEGAPLRLIARRGDDATGAGGADYGEFDLSPTINEHGDVAFRGKLQEDENGVTFLNSECVWASFGGYAANEAGSSFVLLAREGDPAPGFVDRTFSDFRDPAISDTGAVAFPAGTANFFGGIWRSTGPGSLELVIGTDDFAPGTDPDGDGPIPAAKFNYFWSPALIGDSAYVFRGLLTTGFNPDVDGSNDQGIWVAPPLSGGGAGALRLIMRTGDFAPDEQGVVDSANGIIFSLGTPTMNERGQVNISASLFNVPVPGLPILQAMFLYDPADDTLRLLTRGGAELDVAGPGGPSDARTVDGYSFTSEGSTADGRPSGVDDNGLSVLSVGFSGGTSAIMQIGIGGPCPGDFNASGTTDLNDYFDFLGAFFAQLTAGGVPAVPSADVDGSGTVDLNDYFGFLGVFFDGLTNCG